MRREAFSYLDEALALWREQGDVLGEALALEAIGYKRIFLGDAQSAQLAFKQSLALRHQAGAPEIESWSAVGGLCQLLVASGEIERAEPMARKLYELGGRYGNLDAQGDALHYLADCALIGGDYAEAGRRYLQALAHARSAGILSQSTEELRGVALSAAGQGDYGRAVRLAAAASAQREAQGIRPLDPAHWWGKLQEQFIGGAGDQLRADELEEAERAGRAADFDVVVGELLGADG
jgi:tetratricopeptide (TPR) repeat protein